MYPDRKTGGGRHRRGSVMIMVVAVLVIIFLAGSWFTRHVIAIRHQTHRQGSRQLAWNFVRALAILATHKIQFDLLSETPSDGRLKKALGQRLDQLTDLSPADLDLTGGPHSLQKVLSDIVDPVAAQGRLEYSMSYSMQKEDFRPCGVAPFTREKQGLIRLSVEVEFRDDVSTYLFAIPVRVVATVVPGVSKFTLFIQDAAHDGAGKEENGVFNIISTDIDGNLRPSSRGKPIILENGDLVRGEIKWENFFRKPVGLVYLGGGDVVLNLARGESRIGDYGESFHFYEVNLEGYWDGLYATKLGNHPVYGAYALMNWDKGICDDATTPEAQEWWSFVAASPNARDMRLNSALKLFGTDKKQYPTLVLGRVFRGQITARAYKTASDNLPSSFLYHIGSLEMWRRALDDNPSMAADDGVNTIARFARDVLNLKADAGSYKEYCEKYASNYSHYPYNSSLAFYATSNMVADAPSQFGGELGKRMEVSKTNPTLNTLPAELSPVFGNNSSMPALSACLNEGRAFGKRISWVIDLAGSRDAFPGFLVKYGLARMDGTVCHLNLNGWVKLMNIPGGELVIDQPIVLDGPGGLLLERGNITIRAPIDGGGDGGKAPTILTIATKEGDLKVEAEGRVDASLVAPGRVCIRKGDPAKVTIRGSVAGGKLDLITASDGVRLQYNEALACLPPYVDELGALSFSADPNPILIK